MKLILNDGRALENVEQRLHVYFERWLHFYYSYDAVQPDEPDIITTQDGDLANRLVARMSLGVWQPLVGRSIAPIAKDWDLLRSTDRDWTYQKQVTARVLEPLLRNRGIAVARLTKGLHRKRPFFIPICDAFVRQILNVPGDKDISVLIRCMDEQRHIGRRNLGVLSSLREILISNNRDMTELKILDALLWGEVREN